MGANLRPFAEVLCVPTLTLTEEFLNIVPKGAPGPAPSGPQATTESESESESGGPGAATSAVRVGLRRRTGRARLSRRSRRPAAGAQLS